MYLKKIKRLCGVKGCRNTDCYCLSKSAELGTSIIICCDCIVRAHNKIVPGATITVTETEVKADTEATETETTSKTDKAKAKPKTKAKAKEDAEK